MLPMSSSRSHNTQQKQRGKKLGRSQSVLSSLKSLVTGIIGLGANKPAEDFEESPGKRRALGQPLSNGVVSDDSVRSKRLKVTNPNAIVAVQSLIDPAPLVIKSTPQLPQEYRQLVSYIYARESSSATTVPPMSSPPPTPPPDRRPLAASQLNSHPRALPRTMSMDPPRLDPLSRLGQGTPKPYSRDVSMRPAFPLERRSLTRDVSMRDISVRPHPYRQQSEARQQSSFRMRGSMSITPKPTGKGYGPSPPRFQRDRSQPPAITSLRSNPTFVKMPSGSTQTQDLHIETLGMLEASLPARPPGRQRSLCPSLPSSSSAPDPAPLSDKLIRDLDAYRTPFTPTRLRGSSAESIELLKAPTRDMTPILMDDPAAKSGYGRLGQGKRKRESDEGKPFSGKGGLQRLLLRRKEELEEQEAMHVQGRKLKRDASVTTESPPTRSVSPPSPPAPGKSKSKSKLAPPVPPASSSSTSSRAATPSGAPEQSSLRVGRSRASRGPIARPANRPNKVRFSASYEEEEDRPAEEDTRERDRERDLLELKEAAKHVPVFNIPAGFSFLKEGPPVQSIPSKGDEPPIARLPFSFERPGSAPNLDTPTQNSVSAFAEQPGRSSAPPTSAFAPIASSASTVPLATITPVVVSAESAVNPPSTGGSIPNFFANSTIFSKPAATVTPPPASFSFGSTTNPPQPVKDAVNPLWESDDAKRQASPLMSPFLGGNDKKLSGDPNAPSSGAAASAGTVTPLFGAPRPAPALSHVPSFFGSNSNATSAQTVSASEPNVTTAPSAEAQDAPRTSAPSVFANPFASADRAANDSASSSFVFGAAVKPALSIPAPSTSAPKVVPPPLFSSGSTASVFGPAFGAPPTANTGAIVAPEPPKSAFSFGLAVAGTAPPAKPTFGFGSPAAASGGDGSNTPTPVAETPKPVFSFGTPAATATSTTTALSRAAPVPEPSKPTFSFGTSASPDAAPASELSKPTFSFGAATAPAAAPISEPSKPTFSFGTPAASAAAPVTAEPSKPVFSFGQTASGAATPSAPALSSAKTTVNGFGRDVVGAAPATSMFGQPSVAAAPQALAAPKPLFGIGAGGFSFNQKLVDTNSAMDMDMSKPSQQLFAFGATGSVAPSAEPEKKSSPFNFGGFPPSASTIEQKPFSFGGTAASPWAFGSSSAGGNNANATTAAQTSTKSFIFGAEPSRPETPKNTMDMECRMEESPAPARESMYANGLKETPKLNGFGTGIFAPSLGSGQAPLQNGTSSPFAFGGATGTSSSVFGGAGAKMGETRPSAFGQPAAQSGNNFSFNQAKLPGIDTSRPSSTPTFTFGAPTPTSTNGGPFVFGGSSPLGNGMGGTSAFNTGNSNTNNAVQTGSFGLTPTGPPPPFTFGGSQPASPASVGGNLPQTPVAGGSGGNVFTFGAGTGAGGTQSPSSPFSTPPAPPGGALFTIGSAPPPPPPGSRPMKKLPRRGGAKRSG